MKVQKNDANGGRDSNSQVCRKEDMGTFQDVTTSTMERGNSTPRGSDTVRSLQRETAGYTSRLGLGPALTFITVTISGFPSPR